MENVTIISSNRIDSLSNQIQKNKIYDKIFSGAYVLVGILVALAFLSDKSRQIAGQLFLDSNLKRSSLNSRSSSISASESGRYMRNVSGEVHDYVRFKENL